MRILGVDPGTLVTGWGLVAGAGGRPELLDCGIIRPKGESLAERLALLKREFEALVERVDADCAAVESLFHGANARAALQLAHSRGVILATLAEAGLPVAEYTPATVKKSVTDNGRATKEQVRTMVFRLLETPPLPARHDLSDALAVALCHTTCSRFSSRIIEEPRARRRRTGPAASRSR